MMETPEETAALDLTEHVIEDLWKELCGKVGRAGVVRGDGC